MGQLASLCLFSSCKDFPPWHASLVALEKCLPSLWEPLSLSLPYQMFMHKKSTWENWGLAADNQQSHQYRAQAGEETALQPSGGGPCYSGSEQHPDISKALDSFYCCLNHFQNECSEGNQATTAKCFENFSY